MTLLSLYHPYGIPETLTVFSDKSDFSKNA